MAVGCWVILPHGVAVSKARLRPLPLRQRKAKLARIGKGAEDWIALTNAIVGEGRALFRAVVEADLERQDRCTLRMASNYARVCERRVDTLARLTDSRRD
jgi:hypothetical protein